MFFRGAYNAPTRGQSREGEEGKNTDDITLSLKYANNLAHASHTIKLLVLPWVILISVDRDSLDIGLPDGGHHRLQVTQGGEGRKKKSSSMVGALTMRLKVRDRVAHSNTARLLDSRRTRGPACQRWRYGPPFPPGRSAVGGRRAHPITRAEDDNCGRLPPTCGY